MIIFDNGPELKEISIARTNAVPRGRTTPRQTLAITVTGKQQDIAEHFVDGAKYAQRVHYPAQDGKAAQHDDFDKSEFCLAGDIVDHRDGTYTVYMHKETEDEITIKTLQAEIDRLSDKHKA